MLNISPASNATSPVAGRWTLESNPSSVEVDRLGDQIAELSAQIQAATYRLLVLIRDFDERGGWNSGFRSCAHWLNWRTGLDLGAAREKVRVARALSDLPRISEAMRHGELSYSKVRALTRVATLGNEAELLEFALSGTAAHVEKLVRAWRRVDRIEATGEGHRRREQRYLRACHDEDGMLVVRARLSPEVGAVFLKALEAAREALFRKSSDSESPDGAEEMEVSYEQRQADALELVAESALAGGLDPGSAGDRYQVVVHVQEDASERGTRGCGVEKRRNCECRDRRDDSSPTGAGNEDVGRDRLARARTGLHVSAETSRRLVCDSSRVVMRHDADGRVLDVGRKTRTIHPALRRSLLDRDGGCRFPGCESQICDAHHVRPWSEGGRTSLDNLLLLCRHHHRALHEGGFRVERTPDGSIRFYGPKGVLLSEVPSAPVLNRDPVGSMRRGNRESGAEIDESTGLPRWDGGGFDLASAIDSLRQAVRDDAAGPGSDVSAETSSADEPGHLLRFEKH